MRRLVIVLITAFIASFTAPVAAQVVRFGLPAYAELGEIKNAILPVFEELKLANDNVQKDLDWAGLAMDQIAGAGGVGLNYWTTLTADLAAMISASKTIETAISNSVDAESVAELGGSLSPIDTSGALNALRDFDAQIRSLTSQLGPSYPEVSDWVGYAVQVSEQATGDATGVLSRADESLLSLHDVELQAEGLFDTLNAYRGRVDSVWRAVRDIQPPVQNLATLHPPLLTPLLINLVEIEAQMGDLRREVDSVLNRLSGAQDLMLERGFEVVDLVNGLRDALEREKIGSIWETRGFSLGPTQGYSLGVEGDTFDHEYTEIDGEFLLATMSITNLPELEERSRSTAQTVRFEAERLVDDPFLGLVTTIGTHDFTMVYRSRRNGWVPACVRTMNGIGEIGHGCGDVNGDGIIEPRDALLLFRSRSPKKAADYFRIPALGIDIRLLEQETSTLQVWGRYDSPLRVSSIGLEPGSTGGAISLIGDIDEDGLVAFSDFLILSTDFGLSIDDLDFEFDNEFAPELRGDLDDDDMIGFSDFLLLSGNFGRELSSVASVPESCPSIVLVVAVCGLQVPYRRSRRVGP